MAKNGGHNTLRLPPYHYELNPIELAWAMVKGYVKQHNTTYKIDDVKVLLNTAIERVTSEIGKILFNMSKQRRIN
jgi:transposase